MEHERIISAAVTCINGTIAVGKCHNDCVKQLGHFDLLERGFLTNKNKFVDRKTAWKIAKEAGQIETDNTSGILMSDFLWDKIYNKYWEWNASIGEYVKISEK